MTGARCRPNASRPCSRSGRGCSGGRASGRPTTSSSSEGTRCWSSTWSWPSSATSRCGSRPRTCSSTRPSKTWRAASPRAGRRGRPPTGISFRSSPPVVALPFVVAVPHFFSGMFAERFRGERPVYGLRGVSLRPEGNFRRWRTMADLGEELVDEILRRFPGEGCILAGYSFGCSMAFEAARLMEARGLPVHRLYLITPMPLDFYRARPAQPPARRASCAGGPAARPRRPFRGMRARTTRSAAGSTRVPGGGSASRTGDGCSAWPGRCERRPGCRSPRASFTPTCAWNASASTRSTGPVPCARRPSSSTPRARPPMRPRPGSTASRVRSPCTRRPTRTTTRSSRRTERHPPAHGRHGGRMTPDRLPPAPRVPTEAEPWVFPERIFEVLDGIAARIRPDDPALADWCTHYCRTHRARFAADLRLVGRHVAPRARVLEYGAVPLVMTAALVAQGFRGQRPGSRAGAVRRNHRRGSAST